MNSPSGWWISLTRWLDEVAGKVAENTSMVLLLATILSIIRSLQLGQDANWDLKNYHFYNAFALFHHRFEADLAPAMAQTYFNPILDLPFYGLVVGGFSPRWIAAFMALPHVLATLCASKIAWEVLKSLPLHHPGIWWLLACLVNVSGAAGMPLAGSTMNDSYVAALVLGAVWLSLPVRTQVGIRPVSWRVVLGGILVGVAAGAKLTAVPYAIAFFVAIVVVQPGIHQAKVVGVVFGVACAFGFALSAGPWMLVLYHRLQNPFFPLFNGYFQSPFWEPLNLRDTRFGPKTLWSALTLPYQLLRVTQGFVGELPIRDGRLAAVATASCVVLLGAIWRIWRCKSILQTMAEAHALSSRGLLLVLAFFGVGYVLWLNAFAYYRYVLPLEMLSGTLVVALLAIAFQNRRILAVLAISLIFAIVVTTRAPDWGRIAFGNRFFHVKVPRIAPDSLVLLLDRQPLAYLIPFFPDDAHFVGPWWSGYLNHDFTNPTYGNMLQQRINTTIAYHSGPLYSIELVKTKSNYEDNPSMPGSSDATLSFYRLRKDLRDCQPIDSNLDNRNLVVCPLKRVP